MKPRSLKAYGRYGTVGLELVLSMVVGYLLGRWGDSKLGTTWLSWLGAAVGVYAGFRSMFKAAKAMTREAEEADRVDGMPEQSEGSVAPPTTRGGGTRMEQREQQEKE